MPLHLLPAAPLSRLCAAVLVAPLLRAHFFCTESEAYRQQVFYYR